MLMFIGNNMITNAQKFYYFNFYTMLFFNFSFYCMLKSFIILYATSGDFPFSSFILCFWAALCNKDFSLVVKNGSTHANSYIINSCTHNKIIAIFCARILLIFEGSQLELLAELHDQD